MVNAHLFLMVLALVFLLLAAIRIPERYISYGWFGLFLLAFSMLVKA
jgi:hypothetical protein